MDIKTLLDSINSASEKLATAIRIIEICDNGFHRGGLYTEPLNGREHYLFISPEDIREVALVQKQMLESELEILQDAKKTADRVIAGLLPNPKAVTDQH